MLCDRGDLEEYEDGFINEIYYAYEIIQNRDILF